MVKKIIFFIIIFYFLTLFQTSFLAHFGFFGIVPNLVFLIVIMINIFGYSQEQKIASAIVGGFYLDVFSLGQTAGFFGFYTLILLAAYFLIKNILEKYVRIPVFRKI